MTRPLVFDDPIVSVLEWHVVQPEPEPLPAEIVRRAHERLWDEPLAVGITPDEGAFPPGGHLYQSDIGTALGLPLGNPIPGAWVLALADAPGAAPAVTPEDRNALAQHKGILAVVLALVNPERTRAERAAFALRLMRSFCEAGALGIVLPRGYRVIGASAFDPMDADACADLETQLALLTRYHADTTRDGAPWFHTHGMEHLGLPDLEVVAADRSPEDCAAQLAQLAHYLHAHGPAVIKPGDTLEFGGRLSTLDRVTIPRRPVGATDEHVLLDGCQYGHFGAYRVLDADAPGERVAPDGPDFRAPEVADT